MTTVPLGGGDDQQKRADLRRMKVVATGLLVAATVVFVIGRVVEHRYPWVGWIRATAEAAMVGALADWFAVTALFRHPLGIPIPHTAIIPRRKDQIGDTLGTFVQTQFLSAPVLGPKIRQADVAGKLGAWLHQPANAARVAESAGAALQGADEVLHDGELRDALATTVQRRIRDTPPAPIVARALELAMESRHHQTVVDLVLRAGRRTLTDHGAELRVKLHKESPWWVPAAVDDKVYARAQDAIDRYLGEVLADPDHALRRRIDDQVRLWIVRLRNDENLIARVEEIRDQILEHPTTQAWVDSLWDRLKRELLDQAGDPGSGLRRRVAMALQTVGERLQADGVLSRRANEAAERAVLYLAEQYRSQVAALISDTVRAWDATSTSELIEVQVGRDLQFIRINGTVVGGLAGLCIYAVGQLIG